MSSTTSNNKIFRKLAQQLSNETGDGSSVSLLCNYAIVQLGTDLMLHFLIGGHAICRIKEKNEI